jgi:hypothetical protein
MCAKGKTPEMLQQEKKKKRDAVLERFDVDRSVAVALNQAAFAGTASTEDVLGVVTAAVQRSRFLGNVVWEAPGLRLDHDVLIQTDGGDLGQQSLTLFGVDFGELEEDGGVWRREEQEFEYNLWMNREANEALQQLKYAA